MASFYILDMILNLLISCHTDVNYLAHGYHMVITRLSHGYQMVIEYASQVEVNVHSLHQLVPLH